MNISAKVSANILKHVASFFTGSVTGRLVELLQNARRAGAQNVYITTKRVHNNNAEVTITDDGVGVSDLEKLLDLGASGWDADITEAEDPAGIGLFCLAPRAVTIQSLDKILCIEGSGWRGEPVTVRDAPPIKGTSIRFIDATYYNDYQNTPVLCYEVLSALERHAKYSGMRVHLNGNIVADPQPFIPEGCHVTEYPELGCRISVGDEETLKESAGIYYGSHASTLLNFHGLFVRMEGARIEGTPEHFIRVDMTGAPTPLRFMLPARTQLVDNAGKKQLDAAIRHEVYKFVQRHGKHNLPFANYIEARSVGIELKESPPIYAHHPKLTGRGNVDPQFSIERAALNRCFDFTDVEVTMFDPPEEVSGEESRNAVICAILEVDDRIHCAAVSDKYRGYSWYGTHAGKVEAIHIEVGTPIIDGDWNSASIQVYEYIKAYTSVRKVDGDLIIFETELDACEDYTDHVMLSRCGLMEPDDSLMWFCGGYADEGEWSTQDEEFYDALQSMRDSLVGQYETMRRHLVEAVRKVVHAERVTVAGDHVRIEFNDSHNGEKIVEAWPGREVVTTTKK